MRDLYLEKIHEAYDNLSDAYEGNRLKDEHMASLDIIGGAMQALLPIINLEERNKKPVDYTDSYVEILEKRYNGKALPYSLKRKYNEVEFTCPLDLAFAILHSINPSNSEEFVINSRVFNSVDILEKLADKLVRSLDEISSYSVLGDNHSFEEVEDLMRGTDWEIEICRL